MDLIQNAVPSYNCTGNTRLNAVQSTIFCSGKAIQNQEQEKRFGLEISGGPSFVTSEFNDYFYQA